MFPYGYSVIWSHLLCHLILQLFKEKVFKLFGFNPLLFKRCKMRSHQAENKLMEKHGFALNICKLVLIWLHVLLMVSQGLVFSVLCLCEWKEWVIFFNRIVYGCVNKWKVHTPNAAVNSHVYLSGTVRTGQRRKTVTERTITK